MHDSAGWFVGGGALVATGNPVGLGGDGVKAYGKYSGSAKIEDRAKATAKESAVDYMPELRWHWGYPVVSC